MMMRPLFLVIFFLVSGALYGQEISLSAKVNRQQVHLGETLQYTVTVQGQNINAVPKPELPSLSNIFSIMASSSRLSRSNINGEVSSAKARQYTLKPLQEGENTIGQAKLIFKGQTYFTDPITIQVLPAREGVDAATSPLTNLFEAPLPENDPYGSIFLSSQTNKQEVFVGEEIIYQLNLFRRVQLWSNVSLETPEFQGFFVEDLPRSEEDYLKDIEGKKYYVFELVKKSLFPLTPGDYSILPSRVGFIINPFDGKQLLSSKPIEIKVLPLPTEGKPADFSGLVGEFSLSGSFNQNEVDQNTPITLTISVEGKGNLRSIQALAFEKDERFKIYQSTVKDEIDMRDGIQGKRVFEYIIIPKISGSLMVPKFSLSFFSPVQKQYRQLSTQPFPILSKPNQDAPVMSAAPIQMGKKPSELRYVSEAYQGMNPGIYLINKIWFIGAALLNVGVLFYLLLGRFLNFNFGQRSGQTLKTLVSLIEEEATHKNINLAKIQQLYLDAIQVSYGLSLLGKSQEEMKKLLKTKGLSSRKTNAHLKHLNRLEALHFSPQKPSKVEVLSLIASIKTSVAALAQGETK